MKNLLSVFTKPWKDISSEQLGELVSSLGFDAVEFPLRDGYQAQPCDAETSLPKLAKTLASYGLKIASVASSTDENIFAACAEADVPIIRIMLNRSSGSYTAYEQKWKRELAALVPLCEKYRVKVAVQQHFGGGVYTSMELRHLLEDLDPKWIGGIWDAAHSGLAGESPDKALDIVWNHMFMVNFKNAYQYRANGPEAEKSLFRPYFTTHEHGFTDWAAAVKFLKSRGYSGTICMPAEYTDIANTIPYLKHDVAYLKGLLEA